MIEAANLAELQQRVESGNFTRTAADAPARLRIARLPDGKTVINYTDGSEVLLDARKQPLGFKRPEAQPFVRTVAGPPEQWSNGTDTWTGSFSFDNGRAVFNYSNHATRASMVFNGDGTVLHRYKDGFNAKFRGTELTEYTDEQSTARINGAGNQIELTSADGTGARRFTKSGLRWSLGDAAASGTDLVALHGRLSQVYENLGMGREAFESQVSVIKVLEVSYTPGDVTIAGAHDRAARLATTAGDTAKATLHQREAVEIRRVASYIDELHDSVDSIAYTSSILSRLPERIGIEANGQTLRLSSDSSRKVTHFGETNVCKGGAHCLFTR